MAELAATSPPLVLASASPQRREILARIGVSFSVRPTGVPELEHGSPTDVALENALRKACAAARAQADEAVLGADTLVALDGEIHGKPADEDAARRTLQALGGRTHEVHTGIALLLEGRQLTAVASTVVSFRPLTEELLRWSLRSGQWREKSGAYAIQGFAAALVRRIEGDYENVVGLPVATLLDLWPGLLPS
ncbi:MAG: Maf family protein [Solirubrobacteraceae bacterium]